MPRQTAFLPEKQEKLSALPKMRKPFCAFLLSRPVWGAWIEILIRSPGLHPDYGRAPHGAQARSRPSTEPVDGRLCIHAFFSSAPRRSSGRTPGCRHRSSGCGENPAPGGDIRRSAGNGRSPAPGDSGWAPKYPGRPPGGGCCHRWCGPFALLRWRKNNIPKCLNLF